MQQIEIDSEFKSLIPPLTDDERAQLEASLLAEGCRDALVCWRQGDTLTLVDGHNRYELCSKHALPYSTVERSFDSREDAIIWIVNNQLARRNLPPYARGELVAVMEEAVVRKAKANQKASGGDKKSSQSNKSVRQSFAEPIDTNLELGKAAGVSRETMRKIRAIKQSAPEPIKKKARDEKLSVDHAYKLTKALEKASPEIKEAVLKAEIENPELVELLEEKKHTDTVQTALVTGFFQPGEEGEAKPLTELTPIELERGLQKAAKEHKTRVMHEKREQVRENAGKEARAKGIYSIIYADPPWEYRNASTDNAAEKRYPTMPTPEICDLLKKLEVETTKDAALFLWSTNALLPDALEVIKAWGFEYKSNMVWVKNTHAGGFYIQGYHELLLIATKGTLKPAITFKSVIESKRGRHSEKPPLYAMIETMWANQRYIELFAREVEDRENWTFWGGELVHVETAA